MVNSRYRITTPCLGILSENDHRIPITVPVNSIVTVVEGPDDPNRLVDVIWEGTKFMMFTQDLRERAELVAAANPSTA